MKKCSKCEDIKEYSEFSKSKKEKDGYQYHCKKCCKNIRKRYKNNNITEQHLNYRKRNREKLNNIIQITKKIVKQK